MKLLFGCVMNILLGIVVGASIEKKRNAKDEDNLKKLSGKHLDLFLMANQWVKVKQEGVNIASYLLNKGYNNIAIYGMSYAGETLLNELKGTEIRVAYGIDRNAEGIYVNFKIVTPEDPLDQVDVVIVTAISSFEEIKKTLQTKVSYPIISLRDILYEIKII